MNPSLRKNTGNTGKKITEKCQFEGTVEMPRQQALHLDVKKAQTSEYNAAVPLEAFLNL